MLTPFPPRFAPRVLVVDVPASTSAGDGGVAARLAELAHVEHLAVSSATLAAPAAVRAIAAAAGRHDAELIHFAGARLSRLAAGVHARTGLPVTADVQEGDIALRRGWPQAPRDLTAAALAFTQEQSVVAALRATLPNLDVVLTPPVASALPWPSKGAMASATRALRDVRPGRLVVGVPWPPDKRDLRWFRDSIAPRMDGSPLCLVFGAPDRRTAAAMFGARNQQQDFRVLTGAATVDTVAAVARCVDCFAVPAGFYGGAAAGAPSAAFSLALAMGGVPVVTYGESDARVLAHERNAFITEPDEQAFLRTLDQVLSLPAVQRHALGEDFARYTLRRWNGDAAAEVYVDRFAALVGRPQIPADLRAA